jgi:hypothetical protein
MLPRVTLPKPGAHRDARRHSVRPTRPGVDRGLSGVWCGVHSRGGLPPHRGPRRPGHVIRGRSQLFFPAWAGSRVSPDYTAATSRFTGRIHWVQLDLGDDDHGHFLDPEERFRIAIARQ